VEIGSVLSEAWRLYARFLGRFFLTAVGVFAVLDLLSALVDHVAADSRGAGFLWSLVAAVIAVVGYFWVQAPLVETAIDVRDGRADRSIRETYGAVRPRLPAAIVAGVLASIGIGIGLILIVPGLYLLTIWSMLIPVIVIEGRSAGEAFGRSREIVRGNLLSVFGLVIVTFLTIGVLSAVIRALFLPLPGFLDVWLGSVVAHSLTIPFAAAALTTAYFRLTAQEPAEPAAAAPLAAP
jgi:hypothetical protein